MIIFLVGYMGCGKSSIGRQLAKQTGFRFVDMDKVVEKRMEASIREIFSRHGEAFFRKQERQVLEELSRSDENLVVATGGGVPVHGDNMELMEGSGLTVYMRMSPAKLASRLEGGSGKRPLLMGMKGKKLLGFITETLALREPFYLRSAVVVDGDGLSDGDICEAVSEEIAARTKQTGQ